MKRGLSPAFVDLFALMVVLFLLLPRLPDLSEADQSRVGDLVVEISWPDGTHTDIDLWVRAPNDNPVGYSRTRGKHFSLLRDDLGIGDRSHRGEIAASRSLPDGEYAVNVHAYRDTGKHLPFRVEAHVWFHRQFGKRTTIWQEDVKVRRQGEETTLVRWTMADGELVDGSVHHSPVPLRSARGGAQGGGL